MRLAALFAGLAVLAACAVVGDGSLTDHMLQHVGMTLVAPPLLLLAAPLRSAPAGLRRALARLFVSRPVRALAHPILACALFAGVLLASHVPAVYDAALRSPALHAVEHAAYFWTAVLFWLPLVGPPPVPHRLGTLGGLAYLMAAMAAMAIVAAALGGDAAVYEHYRNVADQHAAAAVMWIAGVATTVAAALGVLWPALLREERRQRLREAR